MVDAGLDAGATVWLLECTTPEPVVRLRLERRQELPDRGASDAGWDVHVEQRARWEPVAEVPPDRYLRVDTASSPEDSARCALYGLFSQTLAA